MRLSFGSSPEMLRPSCGRLVRPVVLPSSGSSPEMRRNSDSEMRISAPEISPRRASSSLYLVGSSLDSGGSGQAQAQTEAVKEAAAVEEEEEKGAAEAAHEGVEGAHSSVPSYVSG